MNIWTHVLGCLLFIFLIYLTYAIPVENIFTLRSDVTKGNAVLQCSSKNLADVVKEEYVVNATCVEVASRDENIAEEFSALFYYLSHENYSSVLDGLKDSAHAFFSWYESSNMTVLTTDVMNALISTLQSVYHYLLSYADGSNVYVEKSASVVEVLRGDLEEMNHKVVGHVPRWPIIVFVCCAIWCLGGSAIYHLFYCCNFVVSNILQTLDYCGICILISGSYVPVMYYSFYCYPDHLKLHLTIVIILNVINVCVMATPKFRSPSRSTFTHRQPEYRSVRARSFTLVACYAVFALIDLYHLDGFSNPLFRVMGWYIAGMGGTYILGAVFYGSRFPEKYWPGYFDYVVWTGGMGDWVVLFSSTFPCMYCDSCTFPLCRMLPGIRGSI